MPTKPGLVTCPECGATRYLTRSVPFGRRCRACGRFHQGRKTHGLTSEGQNKGLYRAWDNMRRRCTNPSHPQHPYYGGRGIRICEAWRTDPVAFVAWAASAGWEKGLQLDRIDNDGNYEPSNCRWTTRAVQSRNTRRLFAHNKTGYRGVSQRGNRWRAHIVVDNRQRYLGQFKSPKQAAHAYDAYVIRHDLEHTRNFA